MVGGAEVAVAADAVGAVEVEALKVPRLSPRASDLPAQAQSAITPPRSTLRACPELIDHRKQSQTEPESVSPWRRSRSLKLVPNLSVTRKGIIYSSLAHTLECRVRAPPHHPHPPFPRGHLRLPPHPRTLARRSLPLPPHLQPLRPRRLPRPRPAPRHPPHAQTPRPLPPLGPARLRSRTPSDTTRRPSNFLMVQPGFSPK